MHVKHAVSTVNLCWWKATHRQAQLTKLWTVLAQRQIYFVCVELDHGAFFGQDCVYG